MSPAPKTLDPWSLAQNLRLHIDTGEMCTETLLGRDREMRPGVEIGFGEMAPSAKGVSSFHYSWKTR